MQTKLESRYQTIQAQFERLADFSENDLAVSRALFHFDHRRIVPKRFEVWTCLVGLPLPKLLTQSLRGIVTKIERIVPPSVRFYQVIPENYHWELFIVKRPDESVSDEDLVRAQEVFAEILGEYPAFTITYRGFLITKDGTIIVKGFGEFDTLRAKLRSALPFASMRQSNIGHISLGRILDPVGKDNFLELKKLVSSSTTQLYGQLEVTEAKYVHETQWYMEDREVVAILPLQQPQQAVKQEGRR